MIEPQIQTNPALDESVNTPPDEVQNTLDIQDAQQVINDQINPPDGFDTAPRVAGLGSVINRGIQNVRKMIGAEATDFVEPVMHDLGGWFKSFENRETLKLKPNTQQVRPPLPDVVRRVPRNTLTTTTTRNAPEGVARGQSQRFGQIDPDKEALNITNSSLDQFDTTDKWQINFDTLHTADDVKAAIAYMSEQNKSLITEEQRGVIHDTQLYELAKDLGSSPEFIEKVMTRETGGDIPTAESVLAMRQVLEASGIKLKELAQKVSDPMTATAEDKISFARQYESHSQFQSKFMGIRSEFGRGLRSFGVPTDAADVANIMAHMDNNFDITTIANMINNADNLRGLNQQVNAFSTMWKDGSDMVYSAYMGSMLSGVGTQVAVTYGSIANMAARIGERMFAPLAYSGGRQIDTVAADETLAMLFAYQGAFSDATRAMWKTLTTGEAYKSIGNFGEQFIDKKPSEAFKLNGAGGWLLDKAFNGLTFAMRNVMGGADSFFTVLNERAEYSALAYRRTTQMLRSGQITEDQFQATLKDLFDNPPKDLLNEATNFALEIGLREKTGNTVNNFKSSVNQTPFGRYMVPFINTMANQVDQTIFQRTPAALLSKRFWNDISAGGAKAQIATTKLALGTGTMFTLLNFADDGKITGPFPSDKSARDAWKAAGIQPYSFVYDNPDGSKTYQSYQNLEPFATLFGIAASISEYVKRSEHVDITKEDEDKYNSLMGNVLYAVSENVLNKTFATGMESFFDAFQSPKAMEKLAQSYVNTNIPYSGLRRNLTKEMDDVKRSTDGIFQYVQSQIPTLSESLPPKRDIFGEQIKWEYTYSRYESVKGTKDPVRLEIQRLNEETGRSSFPEFRDMFASYHATPADRDKWLLYARKERTDGSGRNLHDTISDIMQSEVYLNAVDYDKANIIRTKVQQWDMKALKELEATDPVLHEKLTRKKAAIKAMYDAKQMGIDLEDALSQRLEEANSGVE